jgi:hypothetical protein
MSAGSDASNLGYGKIVPNSNVNPNYVNVDNSHYPGGFGSNEIPGLPGLAGAKSNVDAAAGYVPGICLMKGGLKRKIKNITKKYKMKSKKTLKRKFQKLGKRFRRISSRAIARARSISRSISRSFRGGKGSKSRKHRGGLRGGSYPQSIPYPPGYGQYQNNLPLTPSYSVGGVLPASQLGLANPPPITATNQCVDNYNHYTNTGFASRGH